MLQTSLQSRILVAAASVLLLASAATAGPKPVKGKRKAIIEKQANGTVDLAAVARDTTYETEEDAHIRVGTDPQARAAVYADHYDLEIVEEHSGGILNGVVERGRSLVKFTLTGEGGLEGFTHTLILPANFEVHSTPQSGGDHQVLETNMYRIQGEGGGDGVFDHIRLVGGTAFGYPSPGQMTLSSVGGNQVMVDSFFNIGFRIEFRGAEGGPFAGLEGATEGAVIMRARAADPAAPSTH